MRINFLGLLAGFAVVCAGTAQAQQPAPKFHCGELNDNNLPQIQANFRSNTDLSENNFDCLAWQDFIYFMWPAMTTPGHRGEPNLNATFGASGPTVWETYKTTDAVFLPNGQNPGPWNQPQLLTTLRSTLAQQVDRGAVRHLTMTSKVSRDVLANILRSGDSMPPDILDEIAQAGGGTLYDLNGYPVYYEVSMSKIEYEYITGNKLYDANKQLAFAQSHVIALPGGADNKTEGAVEIKAAWKVLTLPEKLSGHFHMVQALLDGAKTPVTVGLVGFHAFISNGAQGFWATFAQVDNAPVQHPATSGTFNFFNPKCTDPGGSQPCAINTKGANPGQVVQINPNAKIADQLNAYMHYLLRSYPPWQYYNLVDVQWAKIPVPIVNLPAPKMVPLPDGQPNTTTLVNAVLETFLQQDGTSCMSCHQYATVAPIGSEKYKNAAGYSFALKGAQPGPK
jgi:hypothetical protein